MAEEPGRASTRANNPPGHDIFCTPENSEFLSKVPYRDLSAKRREIRLLKILPDSGSGFIECELLPSIDLYLAYKQYRALSYCAGDARSTKLVLVNGARCNVFANLHHALTVVRHHWKTQGYREDLLLWVDQICINQANLTERSHQVGFMKDIYRYAKQTFICLSTTKTEGLGLKWFAELWQDRVEDYYQEMAQYNGRRLNDTWDTDARSGTSIDSTRILSDYTRKFLHIKMTEHTFISGLAKFCDFLKSPWWERAWVFQEFMTSLQPTFLLGNHAMPFVETARLLPELCTLAVETLSGPGNTYRRQFIRELTRTHYRPTQIYEAITRVLRIFLARTDWRENIDLKLLLMYTQKSQASDSRDKIYSMIGLAHPGYGIIPNYAPENSLRKVLVETTRRIISFENSLEVLSYLPRGSSKLERKDMLPSWVVDWAQNDHIPVVCSEKGVNRITIGGFVPHHINGGHADASFCEVSDPRDPQNKETVLEVWAVFLDHNFSSSLFPGRYFGSQGYKIRLESAVEHSHELWVLCGAQEPFLLEKYSDGYRLVTQVECEDLLEDLDEGRLGEFADEFGDLDTTRMGRQRIRIF
ncbi:heterokaryon incompatibility protein-domain-containing protein [Fusarium tricinctum]|uniref:Heterokaryon incompatibility protein-domain-containing protein n=1 Tax=Fusarium tricinctum TaxID=61284 RepID=A0A8K0WAT9_9HYPO|nr:heterokaryon incompatibility protein-domain-containing protein [Fusarium tricinctum]